MGVAAIVSHVVSATPSFSGRKWPTIRPCCNVESIPLETVLHELLPPSWVSCAGCNSPWNRLVHISVWATLRVMAFFRHSHLLQCGVPHRLQTRTCSTINLQVLQKNSLIAGCRRISAPAHLPRSFFTDRGGCVVVSLTSHSSPLLQGFPVSFPSLKYVIT